jgi:hypothetical protein
VETVTVRGIVVVIVTIAVVVWKLVVVELAVN